MQTTLLIIPRSAICDAWATHEAVANGASYDHMMDRFTASIGNGPFSYGDTDMTLVTVKRFTAEWPEYEAAVFNVLSSEPDYKCSEPCYIDLEA